MKILVISDVHGNLPALEYVLNAEQHVDLTISLGDVVGYGPWSNECVDLLDSLDQRVLVSGNHETAFLDGQYPGSHPVALAFFDFCFSRFNRQKKISIYQASYLKDNVEFVHTINDAYIFPDTEVSIHRDTFIGHSHRMFTKSVNGYALTNVGSVGQNRVNIDEINYAIWNTELNSVELIRKNFNVDYLINEMQVQGYPEICIDYIKSKRTL
ncbi:metallophosphoesterase [Oleiphilus messinensis]|uniref:Metallophosphoesterase n=1 Tax=Oleiphilus messinensis TaxID=141451 RepID=A0A1Y0IJF1_9GAMM|nr:metallophosphoesterase family protein [Oleiphilus messinensis]ARU59563.1 metallophosphoesterase [Oleiphilus messinensis]